MLDQLKQSILVLYLALCDQRTPWFAKAILLLTVAYLLSPIDLIPDFIPVLGYLDDLLLVPLLLKLALSWIEPELKMEYQQQAQRMTLPGGWLKYIGLIFVLIIWFVIILLAYMLYSLCEPAA